MPMPRLRWWGPVLLGVFVAGCADAPPRTPIREHPDMHIMYAETTGTYRKFEKPLTGGIWVKDVQGPGSDEARIIAKGVLLKLGYPVVEREHLQALLDEQKTLLRYGDERLADEIGVGKLVGAQLVAFLQTESQPVSGFTDGYDIRVLFRVVGVETGEVYFLGTARWSRPAPTPTYGLDILTTHAVARAFCPPERWDEASAANGWTGGCQE